MTYGFHPEARLEYLQAIDFYESRRTGLGAAFTREVEITIQRILEEPTRWRTIEQDVRRCLTPHVSLWHSLHGGGRLHSHRRSCTL